MIISLLIWCTAFADTWFPLCLSLPRALTARLLKTQDCDFIFFFPLPHTHLWTVFSELMCYSAFNWNQSRNLTISLSWRQQTSSAEKSWLSALVWNPTSDLCMVCRIQQEVCCLTFTVSMYLSWPVFGVFFILCSLRLTCPPLSYPHDYDHRESSSGVLPHHHLYKC